MSAPTRRRAISRKPTARLAQSLRLYELAKNVVHGRSGGVCEIDGHHPATEHQHRVRRGMGGSSRNPQIHRPSSLLHVCHACGRDADLHTDRFVFGWSVHRGQDPAVVPVLYRGEWALLDDQGGRTPTTGPDGANNQTNNQGGPQ